jgi:hypothetical protein
MPKTPSMTETLETNTSSRRTAATEETQATAGTPETSTSVRTTAGTPTTAETLTTSGSQGTPTEAIALATVESKATAEATDNNMGSDITRDTSNSRDVSSSGASAKEHRKKVCQSGSLNYRHRFTFKLNVE